MAQLCTALTHPTITITTTVTTNTNPITTAVANTQSATTTSVTNTHLVTDTHTTTTISNIENSSAITTHPAIKSTNAHHYASAIDANTDSLSAITTSGHPSAGSTLIGLDTFSGWPVSHSESPETHPFLSTHPIESTHLRHNWTSQQPELEPHSYAQPRAPPQTQTKMDSFSYTQHPQSELDTFSYTQPYTQEELHSHSYLQTDVESHMYPQAQAHSELESHSYVQSELGTHSYAQLQTQAELNSHSYSQAALEPHSYAQVEQETHSYTQLHTQPALESHSYTQLHSQPFTQSELDMHLYAQGELDAHSYAQAELESHSYAQVHSYTQSRALSATEPLFMEGSHASSSLDHDSLHDSLQEPDLSQGLASHSNSDALSGSFLGSVPAVWDQMDPLVDGISEAESDHFGTEVLQPRTSRSPFSRSGTGFCGSFPGHYGPARGGRGPGSHSPSSLLPSQEGQTPGTSKRVARKEPRRGVRGRGGSRRGSRLPVGAGLGPPTYEAISSGYRVLGWSSGQKVYACEDCGYHTPRRGRMFTHRERHHHPVPDGALLEKVMSGESSHSSQMLQSPPLRMDSSAIGRGGRGRGTGRGRGQRSQRLIVETTQLIPNAGRAGRGGTWIGVRGRGQRTRKSGMDRIMALDHVIVPRSTRGMKRPGTRTRDIMPGSVEDRIVGLGRAASGITAASTTLRGTRMRTRARRGRGSQVLCGVAYRRAGAGRFQCLFCPFVSAHRRSTSRHVLKFHLPNRIDKPDQKSCYNPNPDFFEPPDDVIISDTRERPANRQLEEEEEEEEEVEEEEDSGGDDFEQRQDGDDKKKEQIEDDEENKLVLDNRGGAKLDEIMENSALVSTVGAVEEAIEIKTSGIVERWSTKNDGERQEQKTDEENEKKTADKDNDMGLVFDVDDDQKRNVFEDSKKQVIYGIKTNGIEQNCETLESKFKMKGRGGKGLVSRGRRGRLLAEILGRVASSRKASVINPDKVESRMGLVEQDAIKTREFPSHLIDADASHSTSRLTPTKRSAVVNESTKIVEHPLFPHKRHRIDAIVGQLTGRLNSMAQQQTRTSLLALSSVEGLGMGCSSGDSDVESINSSSVTDPHDEMSELQVDQGNESQTSEEQQGVSGNDKVTTFPYRCKRCLFTCCLARVLTTHYHRVHPYLEFSPSFVLDPTDHSAMFRCVHCRCFQFGNEAALRDHYMEQHPGVISPLDFDNSPQHIRYRCLLCPFAHASARGLSPHYYKAHPGIRVTPALLSSGLVSSGSEADGWVEDNTSHGLVFSCDLCSYQNGNIHSVLNHYQRRHPGTKASFSRIKKLELPPGNPSKAQVSPKGHQVSPQEIEGNPDVSSPYHCHHCSYENRTVQGVLVHYQKRHPEIKVTANYIRRGVSPVRPRTSPSTPATLTVSSPASTPPAVTPQPVAQAAKPTLGPSGMPGLQFYCRECPYVNKTVQGILVHCQKRHPGLRISGELVREYTAVVWSRMEVGQQSAPDATSKEPVALEGGRSGMTRCTDCGYMCSTPRQLSLHRAKRHSLRTPVDPLKVEQSSKVMSEGESVTTGVKSAGGSYEAERLTSGRSPKVPYEGKPKSESQEKPRKVVLSRAKPPNDSMSLITGSTFGCGVTLRAVPGMYSCKICPYVNARLHGVLTHYQKKHPAVRVTGEVFSRGGQPPPQGLLDHLAHVASKVTYGGYVCQLCQFAHPAFEKLVAHMKRSHDDALMAGSHGTQGKGLVESTPSPPSKLVFEEEHQKEVINPARSRLQEEVGGGVLESQPTKEGNLMDMSKQGRTALDGAWRARSCPRCGRAFSSRQTLRAHAHSHLLATLVQLQPACSHSCDRCSFVTALRFRLARHKQNSHPPPPFWKCPQCPLRAPNPWHLSGHCHRVHRTSRIWCCSLCSYATLYHAALNHHHQRRHNQLSCPQQPNTSTVCLQPRSSKLLSTCPTNLLHNTKPSGIWQSTNSVPGCHDLPPILPVMGDEGGDRETSADSPPLLIAQELGKEQVKDVVEGTPRFVQELKDNELRKKSERLKPVRGTNISRKVGGFLHRVADDKMVEKEKVTKKEKTREGGWVAVMGEKFVVARQRIAKVEGARGPALTERIAATTAEGNTPAASDGSRMRVPAASDDSRMCAPAGSNKGRVRAPAGSDEGKVCALAGSDEGRVHAPVGSEGRVCAPAATDENRTRTPATADEGRGRARAVVDKYRVHVHAAVDEGRACVPAASDEGIMCTPVAFDEGVVHAIAASEEMAPVASEEVTSHVASDKRVSRTASNEGTSCMLATTDEGMSHAPAATDEGTTHVPTTMDEGMSHAPAASGKEKGKEELEENKGGDRLIFRCLLCGLESHCRQLIEAHLKEEHKVRQNLSLVIHTASSSS
uniref:C2H2-type domain-containing protein n=1 Tax=Eptatretus burgeri TaxID=7764 RepID=A0A8C4N5N0_EPTBU